MRLLLIENGSQLSERVRVIIASDPRVVLQGVARTVCDAMRAIERMAFEIALVDMVLPDGSGVEIIRRIAQPDCGAEAVVVTESCEERTVLDAIEAGAAGYLIKSEVGGRFVDAILQICTGGSPLSPSIARKLLKNFGSPGEAASAASPAPVLTERELQILTLVSQGHTVGDIASRIYLSPHTVSSHVKTLYRKLHAKTRGQAIHEAYRLRLI